MRIADTREGSSWQGPQMRMGLLTTAIFGDLSGYFFGNFRDKATYWLKTAHFCYPSLIRRPRSLCSLWNFEVKLTVRKLESWGYPPGKTA